MRRPGLREVKRQQTRSAILEAAERLFRERGFSKTRVGDIIERVQVSEATGPSPGCAPP
jgi:AcrR family transcriptional regulator